MTLSRPLDCSTNMRRMSELSADLSKVIWKLLIALMTLYGRHGTGTCTLSHHQAMEASLVNSTLQPRSVKECWALCFYGANSNHCSFMTGSSPSLPDGATWGIDLASRNPAPQAASGMWSVFCIKTFLPAVSPFSASLVPQPWDNSVLINKFLLHRKRSATTQ